MTREATAGVPVPGLALRGERLVVPALGLATALLFVLSLSLGRVPISLAEAIASLGRDDLDTAGLILSEIRLPRAILGVIVGASLGLAGAAMQALLRNPLAEPGILGVSSTAALGAVLVFYTGLAGAGSLLMPMGGMAGALLAVLLIVGLAGRDASVLTLILAGAAINALAGAATALALNLAPSPYAAIEVIFWLLGSLADRSMDHVLAALPIMAAGWVLMLSATRDVDVLTLGEEAAESLGVNLTRLRFRVIAGAALAVGAAVSVTGVIGFVGLVVPHLLRPLVGYRPGRLLIPSALGGAALLLAADIVVRLNLVVDRLATGSEIKIGVVTALIGAPFFLWLVLRTRRAMR